MKINQTNSIVLKRNKYLSVFECQILQSTSSSSSSSSITSGSTTITFPPFYQQIMNTGTFVLCDTSIRYSSSLIEQTNIDCKILNDNTLPAATEAQLSYLKETVNFYELLGNHLNSYTFLIKHIFILR